jgi:hypothetical protein
MLGGYKTGRGSKQIQCHHFRNISLFEFLCMKLMFSCFGAVNNGVESVPAKPAISHSRISALSTRIMLKGKSVPLSGREGP